MGVFENLLEELIQGFDRIEKRISSLEDCVSHSIPSEDFLSISFKNSDNLNITFASKILNIQKEEVKLLVKQGKLNSIGTRKYIFKAEDIKEYLKNINSQTKNFQLSKEIKPKVVKRNEKKAKRNEVISELEMAELLEQQAV